MDYIIPDKIKALCAKSDLSDSKEQDEVKKELVKFLEYYLDLKKGKNSLANITGIVQDEFPVKGTVYTFERDVAGRMVRTRNYTMKEISRKVGDKEIWEVLVIPLDRKIWEKYVVPYSIIMIIIGTLISTLIPELPKLWGAAKEPKVNYKVQVKQHRQTDSLTNLQIEINETAK